MKNQREKLQTWGICAALAVAVAALFCGALDCDFVSYDDPMYVTSNHEIQHGLNARSVSWAFTTGTTGNWHPLTWLSHMMDVQLYGMKPAGHHLTSLLLHAANSVLLFLILKRMTGAMWRSALVAALFALHPLRVESVVWISERKDVLSTLFWMLTVWMYILYTEELKAGNTRSRLFYVLSAVFFALGLMAKPMLVTLPCVLLLIDYWPLCRISSWKKLVLEKLPFFIFAGAFSVVTLIVQRKSGAVASVSGLSVGPRICNAFVSYVRYLSKAVWPVNLGVMYPLPGHWPAWRVIAAILFLALVTWLVLRQLRAQPYLAVGWFWYLGTLVPVSGILQAGIQSMADRFSYVPLVGVFIMAVWGGCELAARHELWTRVAVACTLLALAACCLLTPRQVRFWRSSESLFLHTAEVTDNNYMAYDMVGVALYGKGRAAESMQYWQKSLEINPNYEEALNNLGFALASMGRYREAVQDYEIAVKVKPAMIAAHNNLANALLNLGRLDESMSESQKALDLDPHYGKAHDNYGTALARRGKTVEAITNFREAISDNPDDSSAHGNLANALSEQGEFDDAIAEYRISLRMNPKDAQGHNNLANIFAQQGKLDEAMAELRTALEIAPEDITSRTDLGNIFLKRGDLDEAILQFQKAVELTPKNPHARYNLGDALLQKGNVAEAAAQYQKAVELSPGFVSTHPVIQNNLAYIAWVLSTTPDSSVRNGARAIEIAQRTDELSGGRNAMAIGALAAGYAEVGRFSEAVATAERALHQVGDQNNPDMAAVLQKQLQSYQAGFPFRQPAQPQ